MEFFYVVLIQLFSLSYARLYLEDFPNGYAFDRDLHERVLDEELCKQQLNYMTVYDPTILMQFMDAGSRTPRGILQGNLVDLGNFHQCLSLRQEVMDLTFEGKHCLINVPFNQSYEFPPVEWLNVDPNRFKIDRYMDLLQRNEITLSQLKPETLGSTIRFTDVSTILNLSLRLALCIPKVCTVKQAIDSILNVSTIGFIYEDVICRIPNDKHWVAGDYVAISLFSILGFLIVVSTLYDFYHLFYLKKSSKRVHPLRLFSAYTNMGLLLRSPEKPGTLECLDGIRALAMIWVVLGHTFYIIPSVGANLIGIVEWQRAVENIWVTGALHSVDTFFMLSGLLVVYIGYVKFTPMSLLKNLHKFYLGRILRMFPLLATMILFEASLYNRVSDGGFWYIAGRNVHMCRAFWWTTLLHVQNFVNPNEVCLGVTWYLAIDVQLHLLSPLVLFWLLRGRKRDSWLALLIGVAASMGVATVYIFLGDISEDYFAKYYVNILTRATPFFVGMIVGYVLRIYRNQKIKMAPVVAAFTTVICIGLLYVILYVNYLKSYTDFKNETASHIIDGYSRSMWAACLGWIIFVCVHGYGGPINWFLCLQLWKIPAKVSYGMYLVHYSIMIAHYSTAFEPVYFTVPSTLFKFCGFLVITIAVAILVTALIDIPFAVLFKTLLDTIPPHSKPLKSETPVLSEDRNTTPPTAPKGLLNPTFVPDEIGKNEEVINKDK